MSNPKFFPTHRMLVKASEENFDYNTVEIDIINGTFKRTTVKANQTFIRVNKSILGEILNPHRPLGLDEVDVVSKQFNEVRVATGFSALNFRVTEDVAQARKDGALSQTP